VEKSILVRPIRVCRNVQD